MGLRIGAKLSLFTATIASATPHFMSDPSLFSPMSFLFCGCDDEGGGYWSRFFGAGRRGGALDEAADEEERMQHMTMQREEQIKLHSKVRAGEHRKTVVSKPIDINATYEPPSYPKSDAEIKCIDEALGENFIFSELTHEQRLKLIDAMQKEQVAEGTAIITQGDEKSDFFYVVEEGTVNFIANGNHVGSCSKGGSFGELALLYNSPRAASCLAETKCKLWKVDQYTFRYMLARNAHEQEQDLCKVINKIDLFSTLDMKCKLKFAESMTRVKFACGERIVTKGDPGEVFYIIENGNVKISDIGLGDSQAVDQILTAGDWFGERSLLTGEPRAATVTAVSDVTCLAVARNTFESTIGSLSSALDHGMKKHFLKSLPLFAHSAFNDHEIDQLADLVTEQCFRKGDKLAEMDKPYRRDLWIIRHGRLLVVGKKGKTYKLKTGDYFGDKSVKAEKGRLSSHDAIVEENTTCWVLSREDMESVIGDINRLGDIVPFAPSTLNKTITLNRLKKHRILGMGAFGKVWLVSHKTTKAPYALKVIDKKVVVRAQQAKSVIREKNIMASLEHPLLISLVASFQDDFNLYLVLGLIQGGELFSILHKDGRKNLPVSDSRFYAACVVEALNHLHQRNIAYRDLKPENVLIDADGYGVVVDLGFAKVVVDKTYTLCGTPEYLAPEIIMSRGHGKEVDCWSFGVLIYEMLVGVSPFFYQGMVQTKLFKRIVNAKYNPPDWMDESAKDLVAKLLVCAPASRLGNLSGGWNDVRNHEWFQDIDFKKLAQKEIDAPWKPKINDPLDSSNFDDFQDAENGLKRSKEKLSREDQALFKDF